jgi:hypothetical protein
MFKDIQSGFTKFFTRDKIIIFIALLILGYALFAYSDSKSRFFDNYEGGYADADAIKTSGQPAAQQSLNQQQQAISQKQSLGNGGYATQTVANPSDLLPVDQNSQWAALNPVAANQGSIVMPDLLQAGYHIGLDTIGQTLRNANLQLRSDPIIPKQDVGPWMNSTIEPDLARTPLELGYGVK